MTTTSRATSCVDPSPMPTIQSDLSTETSLITPYRTPTPGEDIRRIPRHLLNITRSDIVEPYHQRHRRVSNWQKVMIYSSCPSKFVTNMDNNRRPEVMTEAICARSCCSGYTSCVSYRCQEILYYVPVLRRTACVNEIYQYEQIVESFGAGCTCMKDTAIGQISMPLN